MRADLAGLTAHELSAWLAAEVGHAPRFHRALFTQIMTIGRWDPSVLPLWREAESTRPGVIARLETLATAQQMPRIVHRLAVTDRAHGSTVKMSLGLADGHRVESVLIPMHGSRHRTICVSSQVGCAMGCGFCHTASMGLIRQLAAHEIIGQVLALADAIGQPPRSVVFMGMGEPLDNPAAVAQAVRVLRDPAGLGLASRHITVSTVGRVEALRRWAELGLSGVNLAVSLFAADDDLRNELMPVNRRGGLAALRAALGQVPLKRGRHILLSVVVIPGVNDGAREVAALATWVAGLPVLVNLIPYNPIPSRSWRAPTSDEIAALRTRLERLGVAVRLRATKGDAVMAACGQLGDPRLRPQRSVG
jgi:23S rRNA (adenine2503-C2)-methyltransferase